jgi:uncharacterized protein (DUF849 family)
MNMKAPQNFQVLESHCCYRLSGDGQLTAAASEVAEVIAFARERGVRRLLIDTTGWIGHMSPDTLERYHFARVFAQAAGSAVKLVLVVRPAMMDPEKFEVVVAQNHGLVGNVFDSEQDALAWLLDPATG